MKCHLLETGTRIEPFLDPIADTPIANVPLGEWQRRVLASCGLELAEPGEPIAGPCLVMADDLFITRGLLRAFLAAREGTSSQAPCALRVGPSAQLRQSPLQELDVELVGDEHASATLPLWWLPPGHRGPPPELEDCEPITVEPKERLLRIPVPEHWFGSSELLVPLTKQFALRMGHWVHLLLVNRMAWALELLELSRWRLLLLAASTLLRAVVPTRARLLRAVSRVGRSCDIHPTAVIEGSIIEDGVRIGPFAVVRFSRVGAGTWIQDHGKVTLSVLGERSLVSAGSTVNLCVTYPQASASQILMQLSVLGRRAITTGGGFMMDMRFDGDVRVLHRGEVRGAGSRFLGSAIGHDVILGTGFWLAPGRSIPNGAVVVRDPEQIVRRVPDSVEPGTVLVPRGGALVPLRSGVGEGDDTES